VVVVVALPSPFFFPGRSSAALVSQFSYNTACVVPLTGWQMAAIESGQQVCHQFAETSTCISFQCISHQEY